MDTNGNDNASGGGSSLGGGVDLAKSPGPGAGVELGRRGLPKLREIIIRNREDSELGMAARTTCVTRCCGCFALREAALVIGLALQLFQLLYLLAVCGWAAGLAPRPAHVAPLLALLCSPRAVAVPVCGLLMDAALMVAVLARLRALLALWLSWYACVLAAGLAGAGVLLADAARWPEPAYLAAVLAYTAALALLAYWWLVVLSLLCNFERLVVGDRTKVAPAPADAPASPESPA
ncbi:hypothetical protein FJT64_007749 [Amphibalanus amphitrite]|uniref:Uncharacterized protein n=1 Tax=Amphibalanus amphitrite TaxID=1232801 RepID=A0A6A4VSP8_AMPAM|nr:hypothetical protein FJT64_007749 [Amphibalanus amphitrite]